jgi:hypothetical protein
MALGFTGGYEDWKSPAGVFELLRDLRTHGIRARQPVASQIVRLGSNVETDANLLCSLSPAEMDDRRPNEGQVVQSARHLVRNK